MIELLSFSLREHGYQVRVARHGLEALNQARLILPDLVLLDLMLDGMDGFCICEILRCQPSMANTPIIMVKALCGQIARPNGFASGVDEFMTKPFSPQSLIRRIDSLLQSHQIKL